MTDRVLSPDELDVLELVLGGAIPEHFATADLEPGDVLTDAENTPLARWDGTTLAPDRPCATEPTAAWDPAVRRAARTVLGEHPRGPRTAVILDGLPTWAELRVIKGLAAGTSVTLVVPTRRSRGQVAANATCRAAQGLVESVAGSIDVLAIPFPISAASPSISAEQILRGYGLTSVIDAATMRDDETTQRMAELESRRHDAVAQVYPPASAAEYSASTMADHRGTVILFTGLSGSGKSTIARALTTRLEDDGRTVTLLDGDVVRQHLSKGLGFSREDRELNLERIGYVASLITHHGGTAIAAPIAPFAASRNTIRTMAENTGARFILVHVNTPLEVCEARDRKGLYAKARAGEVPDFTGISSPYESPSDATLTIDATDTPVPAAVDAVVAALTTLRDVP